VLAVIACNILHIALRWYPTCQKAGQLACSRTESSSTTELQTQSYVLCRQLQSLHMHPKPAWQPTAVLNVVLFVTSGSILSRNAQQRAYMSMPYSAQICCNATASRATHHVHRVLNHQVTAYQHSSGKQLTVPGPCNETENMSSSCAQLVKMQKEPHHLTKQHSA
jgi:hypothetical protein